ncbi:hypothetical protein HNP37_004248 [Flavobacterium nitrogenifigens]|uniref:DUF4369 domain-containing protein n=2 Tax=Flavobacterium TaxID=237 RepID=A0A7W7J1P8_9FLAO|nr:MULTISPECIES: hypothetical protein [Flavobacterium]MBB4804162.1 hypothetical protein [Flavobacterium nitrogenifigens]MBB6389121.1 hypothetical protein [Flavobacterium notoginsengisoli]
MKLIKPILAFIFFLSFSIQLSAETWNEPWQKEIIKKAEYFVLGKVIKNGENGVEIEILKSFGNSKIESKNILISGFSMLRMTSSSGHGIHLDFDPNQTFYLFLVKNKDGNYDIPTPTSGFALLDEKNTVTATYRHSYHQALIPQDAYEKTYSAIWDYYKTGKYDQKIVLDFINENIDKAPAGFEENEISTFFLQHAALETAYLLDISIDFKRIQKFFVSDNFHSRVSTLQLLANSKDAFTKAFLLEFIKNAEMPNFEKVIAIKSLWNIGDIDYQKKLIALENSVSDEETGFGGNIMDPRIGTYFPTPKGAIQDLKNKK